MFGATLAGVVGEWSQEILGHRIGGMAVGERLPESQ